MKKLSGFPYISIIINNTRLHVIFNFFFCVDKSLKTACWFPMDLFWVWCELMSLDIFDVWFTTTCREENYILALQRNKTKQLGRHLVSSYLMAVCFVRRESQDPTPLQDHLHSKNFLHTVTSTIWPGLQINFYLELSNKHARNFEKLFNVKC